jgi:CheY-like chemotaxis protein
VKAAILVVDDDADVRETVSEALREAGYAVFGAASGEEALGIVPSLRPPCLILLDNSMPGMGGRDFLWRLVDLSGAGQFPVILISGTVDEETATLPGVVATLWKPFDLEQLLEAVGAHASAAQGQPGPGAETI